VDGRLEAQVAVVAVTGRVGEAPAVEEAGRPGLVEEAVGQRLLLGRRRLLAAAVVAGALRHQATLRYQGPIQLGR